MFDIGWGEMLVIAIVVIVVVGPKELPGMLRTFGRTTSKLRVMANDFRKQFDDALKEAELDDLKKVADDVRSLNPKNEIRKALSPMEKAAQDVRAGLDSAMKTTPAATPQPTPEPASSTAGAKPVAPAKAGAAAIPGETATKQPAPKAGRKPAAAKVASTAVKKPAGVKPVAVKPKAAPKPRATKKKTGGDVA